MLLHKIDRRDFPEDWQVLCLDKVTKRGSGHTPDQQHPEYWNGEIKWVSLTDSGKLDKGYIYDTAKKISSAGIANSSAVLHPAETVIISRDAGVGKSAVLAAPMAVSQHFIAWQCDNSHRINSWFLYYWLQYVKREFERQAVGSTIKTIGLPYFKKILLPHPEYQEQSRIACILSTWDQAIEATEKLIENSKAQKKALMQQLLTGKKRLPGFSGEWLWLKASEIFQPVSNRGSVNEELLSVTQDQGVVPRSSLERKVVMPRGTTTSYKLVVSGNFVISLRSFQGGLEYSKHRGLVSPAYTVLEPVRPIRDSFFRHYFKSREFIARLAVAVVGIRDGKQISYGDFSFLRLPYPPKVEQTAISKVLDTGEAEIKILSDQLSSLKKQKKALMQQLLTGKRRVKVAA